MTLIGIRRESRSDRHHARTDAGHGGTTLAGRECRVEGFGSRPNHVHQIALVSKTAGDRASAERDEGLRCAARDGCICRRDAQVREEADVYVSATRTEEEAEKDEKRGSSCGLHAPILGRFDSDVSTRGETSHEQLCPVIPTGAARGANTPSTAEWRDLEFGEQHTRSSTPQMDAARPSAPVGMTNLVLITG